MRTVRYLPQAREELLHEAQYFSTISLELAQDFSAAVRKAEALAAEFAEIGHAIWTWHQAGHTRQVQVFNRLHHHSKGDCCDRRGATAKAAGLLAWAAAGGQAREILQQPV